MTEAARLWRIVAVMAMVIHLSVVLLTQDSSTLALMSLIIWGGAFLCIEDTLPTLNARSSNWSFLVGTILFSAAIARSTRVIHLDAVVYILPLCFGISLFLLALPVANLKSWIKSLVVLSLLPLIPLVSSLYPEATLSHATARIGQVILTLFSVDASIHSSQLILSGGAVNIAGACTGINQILQLAIIGIIFLLAFPLPSPASRVWMVPVAMAFAIVGNAIRITLLAVINASDWMHKTWWFDFFHEEDGSLLFSLLTVAAFGLVYFNVLDRQLSKSNEP